MRGFAKREVFRGVEVRVTLSRRAVVVVGCVMMLAGFVGCAPSPTVRVTPMTLTPIPTHNRFAAGLALVGESQALQPGESWRVGDQAVFGIALDLPSGDREWYVRMRLSEHPAGPGSRRPYRLSRRNPVTGELEAREVHFARLLITVELFDHEAKAIMVSSTEIAEPCARYGLFDWIERQDAEPPISADADELARVAAGWLFLTRMPGTLQGHREFRPMLMSLMARPSLWSILLRGEIVMELDPQADRAIPTRYASPAGGPEVEAYRLPMEFRGNDRLMLQCELLVAQVAPPLGACGGVVAADAWNPLDPRRRAAVRLLGVTRNEGAP